MALTYGAPISKSSIGNHWLIIQPLTPASSDYPTGGYVLDPTLNGQMPDGVIRAVWYVGMNQAAVTSAYTVQYNNTTLKLQVFGGAASGVAGAEVANAADLSAIVFTVAVIGK
jgi:hypothetical protein